MDRPYPVYLTIHPQKPTPPDLQNLEWKAAQGYFVLTPEEYDKYINNLSELDTYIAKLQAGWKYYERASTEPEGETN